MEEEIFFENYFRHYNNYHYKNDFSNCFKRFKKNEDFFEDEFFEKHRSDREEKKLLFFCNVSSIQEDKKNLLFLEKSPKGTENIVVLRENDNNFDKILLVLLTSGLKEKKFYKERDFKIVLSDTFDIEDSEKIIQVSDFLKNNIENLSGYFIERDEDANENISENRKKRKNNNNYDDQCKESNKKEGTVVYSESSLYNKLNRTENENKYITEDSFFFEGNFVYKKDENERTKKQFKNKEKIVEGYNYK